MLITRTSPLTGKEHTQDLPVTQAQMDELRSPGRRLIQDIFPELTASQREFIMTGYTADDWEELFGDDEYDDDIFVEGDEPAF